MIMPFAGFFNQDVTSNFTFCIQNMQTSYMGELLRPLNYAHDVMGSAIGVIENAVQSIRAFFHKIRTFVAEIISAIMAVFLNILIEFQRLIIYTTDLFSKLVGVTTTTANIIAGSNFFSRSVWEGPPGQTMRAIGSVCFDPETLIKKYDGKIIKMNELELGDRLKNGEYVKAKMSLLNKLDKLDNSYIDDLYSIENGEDNKKIIVSGSHLIYNKTNNEFIHVKNYDGATKCEYNLDELFCLITSDHTIPLGDYIFHDWEDNNGSKSKNI